MGYLPNDAPYLRGIVGMAYQAGVARDLEKMINFQLRMVTKDTIHLRLELMNLEYNHDLKEMEKRKLEKLLTKRKGKIAAAEATRTMKQGDDVVQAIKDFLGQNGGMGMIPDLQPLEQLSDKIKNEIFDLDVKIQEKRNEIQAVLDNDV